VTPAMIPTASDNTQSQVLIVDNDPQTARVVLGVLARRAIHGTLADKPQKALDYADRNIWKLALIDRAFAESSAEITCRRLLARLKSRHPELPVIMLIDGSTDMETPPEEYAGILSKPVDESQVEQLLDTFVPNHKTKILAHSRKGCISSCRIVGCSGTLAATVELARKVAPTSAPVLIAGQSGTGKELIAQLIHAESRRAGGPFVKVNCAALNDGLLESELFGHEKGAFTGASRRHKGRFERASGGTLLLDEITETQPRFQAKLLRVLEQMSFERVGGAEDISVNVRVLSTTNTDILAEVESGRFRADLYYRLASVKLTVPPLCQRKEDIIPLTWLFVNEFGHEAKRPITSIDTTTLEILHNCDWPGNVRQLRNVIRTALIFGDGEVLSLADAPWLIEELQPRRTVDSSDWLLSGESSLEELERRAILATLRRTDGNKAKAAKVLGISDRTLRDKVKRYERAGELMASR